MIVCPKCDRPFSQHNDGECPTEPELPTTEKLARAMEEAGVHGQIVQAARDGYFDDYKSPLPNPIGVLVQEMNEQGFPELARRAMNGEFDATKEEADQWAKSPEGRQTFAEFYGDMTKKHGMNREQRRAHQRRNRNSN